VLVNCVITAASASPARDYIRVAADHSTHRHPPTHQTHIAFTRSWLIARQYIMYVCILCVVCTYIMILRVLYIYIYILYVYRIIKYNVYRYAARGIYNCQPLSLSFPHTLSLSLFHVLAVYCRSANYDYCSI